MCGRFTQRYTWCEIHDLYDLTGAARNLQAHYNIAPMDTVEVAWPADIGTELVRWPRNVRQGFGNLSESPALWLTGRPAQRM
jgi:putative SOS response-associated peptidase YedK